jgi:4-hydroxybenzoate polyprenyltransferase
MGILSTVIAILLYFYSSDFKAEFLMGNLLVSMMAGMVVYIASRGVYMVNKAYFAEFSSIAFFITFARELIKDLEDYDGDKQQGYETFAISSGRLKTKALSSLFIVCSMGLLILIGLTGNELEYWVFTGLILGPLHLYLLWKIYMSSEKKHYSHISKWLKYAMFIGLLASLVS